MAPQLLRLALPISAALQHAIDAFDCLGEDQQDDPVAQNVSCFLSEGRFQPGIQHGVSSTFLLIDADASLPLIGYTTLTLDSVRLTNSEKRRMEEVNFGDFGALRIQMIGVDCRHQQRGHGTTLLRGITGLARVLNTHVSVRFLLADANVRKVSWYERHGFVRNQAERETRRVDAERSVSMRLDLLESLQGDQGGAPAPAPALLSQAP